MMLGILTTGCVVDCEEENLTVSSDYAVTCQPANDTHYSVCATSIGGTKVSALAPYIYESAYSKNYEVVNAAGIGEYSYNWLSVISTRHYVENGFSLVQYECCLDLCYTSFIGSYEFVITLPKNWTPESSCYEPSFEVADTAIKELGEETDGDNTYYCSEVTVTLKAHQGEKVFDFIKTFKVRQPMVTVSFDIVIDSGFDGDNNTQM